MATAPQSTWVADARGNPSRWCAFVLAVLFATGCLAATLAGYGYRTVVVLAFLFTVCFNVAFGRRGVAVEMVAIVCRLGSKK